MVALSRNVTPKHAMEMLLTGDVIDARRGPARIGLVNRVVPANELSATVVASVAAKIASKSMVTVKTGKAGLLSPARPAA